VALEPWSGRQLPRDGGRCRELVERIRIKVALTSGGGVEQRRLPVRADDDRASVDADRKQCDPPANVVEDAFRLATTTCGARRIGADRCRISLRRRLARRGLRRRPGTRGLLEQIAELILAEAWCARNEIDPRDLSIFGSL